MGEEISRSNARRGSRPPRRIAAPPASAGDTNLKVESTGGPAVGAELTIDPDGSPETVPVTSVGSGPSGFLAPTLVAWARAPSRIGQAAAAGRDVTIEEAWAT